MPATADFTPLRPAKPELHDVVGWIDARVRDAVGHKLGRVSAVFADRDGQPWWIVVRRRGRTLVAPVSAVDVAGQHQVLLSCTEDALVATDDAEMSDALHSALIQKFGLDRRCGGARRRVERGRHERRRCPR